jgi:hypothetical protein
MYIFVWCVYLFSVSVYIIQTVNSIRYIILVKRFEHMNAARTNQIIISIHGTMATWHFILLSIN